MRVYTTTEGRMIAEAESVADIRALLALTAKKTAIATERKKSKKRRAMHTKTHSCGMKYKYLSAHMRKCPENVSLTRVP